MRIAATKAGLEPIPGYTLRKRLGAGGYGEVWLADAPGGLKKAIKLIFGTIDESHAASEMKSLDRVRKISHPFLLSLERIEVVNSQVVIVTELADGSLLDRFEQHRRKGEPGIPRSLLLDFLHDTADGLDFLAQQHSLQHLDVKPGNLLIVADRVKVADFGLVKDLHDTNQSLVGGLTPTYSAPEVFDGRPDYRSDQYSLAIVYMEMLTGRLPFSGNTTGELARQHINQVPDLEALPPADRSVVNRALSKNPLDRYGTCRLFVEQLQKARGAVIPQVIAGTNEASEVPDPAADADADTDGIDRSTSTFPTVCTKQVFQQRLHFDSNKAGGCTPRCLFVGIGGMGCGALLKLRDRLLQNCDSRLSAEDHGWIAVDTEDASLAQVTDQSAAVHLPQEHAVHLPLYKPTEYRGLDSDLFLPLSRRWLYNIPKSLTTEGVRPIAILALLHHYSALKAKLQSELSELVKQHEQDDSCDEPIRVYLLTSLHGGTGGGLVCEMGLLVRQILSELSCNNYRISAIVSAATTTNSSYVNLPSAAAMTCLSEMAYLMKSDHEIPPIHPHLGLVSNSSRPFDWVTLVDGGLHGNPLDADSTTKQVAAVVVADSQTLLGSILAEERTERRSEQLGWLRTSCANTILLSSRVTPQRIARWCCEQALRDASNYMSGPRGYAAGNSSNGDSNQSLPTTSGDLPLTDQACSDWTRRLLSDLGVVETHATLAEITNTEEGNSLLNIWARRLSNSPELVARQLHDDIETWKKSIAKIVQMRVYNWKQIEKLQLSVVEGILDYCEHETAALVRRFEPFSEMLGAPERMLSPAIAYLRRYTEECVALLDRFQRDGKLFAKKLCTWCNSIAAERALNEVSGELNVLGLPSELQLLAGRVNSVIETTLHREAKRILNVSAGNTNHDELDVPGIQRLSLQHIVTLASDLVRRIANEIGIDLALLERDDCTSDEDGVVLEQLQSYCPILSQRGGKLYRFAIAPTDQIEALTKALAQRSLADSTTVISSSRSLGTHVACDAGQLNVQQIVSSLWRPGPQTLQLAERLRTRVDIDWDPVTALLENNSHPIEPDGAEDACGADTQSVAINPISVDFEGGTMQIPT